MGTSHLIDSNAIIETFNGKIQPNGLAFMRVIFNSGPQASVVTEIEVLGFTTNLGMQTLLAEFFDDCQVLPLSRPIVEQTILLRKMHKIKLPDAIIAATAIAHGLTLITRNTGDFSKIVGLKTIDPHTI